MRSTVRQSVNEYGLIGAIRQVPDFLMYQVEARLLQIHNRFRTDRTYHPPTDLAAFEEVLQRSQTPTDINDYLDRLIIESLHVNPNTIVELGVRGGESTFVFERVACMTDADIVSIDIEDCSDASDYDSWQFVQSDDVEFAGQFDDWCSDHDVNPEIDALFVDTSHQYKHTLDEIDNWFPHLSNRAVVFFHDTNLTRYYRREDGTLGTGWDNDRGVIRALEAYFECSFDETEPFVTVMSPFIVKHSPYCNGMTILQKVPTLDQ